MDQFDVLVESYGIKPQGKSAPMASVKSNFNSGIKTQNSKPANSSSSSYGSSSRSTSNADDHDHPFQFNSGTGFPKQNSGGFGDFDTGFQFPPQNDKFANGTSSGGNGLNFDVQSMFRDSMNLGTKPSNSNDYDGLLSGFSGKNTPTVNDDDLLSSMPKKIDPVDDLFGNLEGIGSGSGGSISRAGNENRRNEFGHEDELIPGFGTDTSSGAGAATANATATATNNGTKQYPKIPKPGKKGRQEANFIDIESTSDMGGQYGTKEDGSNDWNFQAAPADAEVDLGSFFTAHIGKSNANVSAATIDVEIDPIFSVLNHKTSTSAAEQPIPVQKAEVDIDSWFSPPNVKIGAGTRNKPRNQTVPDFDFFGEGSMASAGFEEIEGEDDERRRARYESYLRTKARMAKALAEMNSREFKAQQEREERHRIADIKDSEMKLWAAGKEGNLRALLSSLDQVLWPECGWKALSLTDLITSSQVKLAYKKAALYVHPDKVQQKGATAQQKYVAEKVFDLLKEAWNKFNQEELR